MSWFVRWIKWDLLFIFACTFMYNEGSVILQGKSRWIEKMKNVANERYMI